MMSLDKDWSPLRREARLRVCPEMWKFVSHDICFIKMGKCAFMRKDCQLRHKESLVLVGRLGRLSHARNCVGR